MITSIHTKKCGSKYLPFDDMKEDALELQEIFLNNKRYVKKEDKIEVLLKNILRVKQFCQ